MVFWSLVFLSYEVLYAVTGWEALQFVSNNRNAPWEIFFGNKNLLAQFVVLALFAAFKTREKTCQLIFIAGLILIGCKSVLLGLLMAGGLCWWPLLFLIPVVLAFTNLESIQVRWELYKDTWEIIKQNPWGIQRFWPEINTYRLGEVQFGTYSPHPDSDFLLVLAKHGWLFGGLTLLVFFFGLFLIFNRKNWIERSFACVLLMEFLFQHPIGSPWLVFLMFLPFKRWWIGVFVASALFLVKAPGIFVVTPARKLDFYTQKHCEIGSSFACRFTGDWRTALSNNLYDPWHLRSAALSTKSCEAAWLFDSMVEKPLFKDVCKYPELIRTTVDYKKAFKVFADKHPPKKLQE